MHLMVMGKNWKSKHPYNRGIGPSRRYAREVCMYCTKVLSPQRANNACYSYYSITRKWSYQLYSGTLHTLGHFRKLWRNRDIPFRHAQICYAELSSACSRKNYSNFQLEQKSEQVSTRKKFRQNSSLTSHGATFNPKFSKTEVPWLVCGEVAPIPPIIDTGNSQSLWGDGDAKTTLALLDPKFLQRCFQSSNFSISTRKPRINIIQDSKHKQRRKTETNTHWHMKGKLLFHISGSLWAY